MVEVNLAQTNSIDLFEVVADKLELSAQIIDIGGDSVQVFLQIIRDDVQSIDREIVRFHVGNEVGPRTNTVNVAFVLSHRVYNGQKSLE